MLRRPERYATLMRVRKREEDARAAALAKAARAVTDAEMRRAALAVLHDDAMRRATEAAFGTDANAMEQFTLYERHLTQVIGRTDGDIARLQSDQRARRTEFEASHRRRKMIDRIMERTATRWNEHVEREDRKAVEETVAMRYGMGLRREGDR